MKPVIEFKDFSFRYKSQTEDTLKHVDLTIYEGEKVLITGPSGCGKSTLSSCINGLIPFSFDGEIKGSCKIDGIEVQDASIFQMSSRVGTVLQDSDAQFVGLSVGEDIAYALENDNMPRVEMIPRVYESAKIVDMHNFLEQIPYDLSGGQKQRVALAGIMHDDVKILMFDEPLAALDPMMGNFAIDLIDRIHKEYNKTIVIIEHRIEDVLYRDIDRIILMKDGTILADMTPDELLVSNLLKENGVREPLYITALKNAGCELESHDVSNVFDMDLAPYKDKVIANFNEAKMHHEVKKNEVIIDVQDVSFGYDSRSKVLNNVSFQVTKGEKIAIVGKNGAGKSTIAKLLCGIIRPNSGHILLKGEDYMQFSIKEIGEKIGYVMQNPNQMIVKDMIKDEVGLGLSLRHKSEAEIEEKANDTLKMCNLYSMRNWPISALSYGQKKRVTIASILAMSPEVIILDEPTAGQDYRVYTEIMTFLEKLNKDFGITILFITHDMHLAIEYTDRAIVFTDGECIGDDSVFKILGDANIIERAHLKETSLFTLSKRLGIPSDEFTEYFIAYERMNRHE
ncbi:MAG: ABC transporter ATP-binding protein [Erysipelotrichaceae bacterium]|nr:ABC transporter ATP-binding protein [Erysipelotrichaceae bacterium]